jgi:FkbM family methyltransferase
MASQGEVEESLLRLVDVGAMGGVHSKWKPYLSSLWAVLVEPNADEAKKLSMAAPAYGRCTIIDRPLWSTSSRRTLYVTKNPTCVSLLKPNDELLANYGIAPHFEVVNRLMVECVRYDELFRCGKVPGPDVVKLDVQGAEYEVLLGFGNLLSSCLGIEIEAHFYSVYRSQKLFSDMVQLLGSFGYVLRKVDMNKIGNFDGDIVEVDACFTGPRRSRRALGPAQRDKWNLMCDAWNLDKHQ